MSLRLHVPIGTLAVAALAGSAPNALAEPVFGVTSNQTLISFDSATPGVIETGAAITGLQPNEQILGIDLRPATNQLYALGSFSNLYVIDMSTGGATPIGDGFSPSLNGSSFGFDFNPTIDRIRVVSEANQNLVLNPDDGTATQVTDLFYGPGDANEGVDPNVVGASYTNSFDGAVDTQLYVVDTGLDLLATQANNTGVLGTVGSLGVDVNDSLSFDISGASGIAFASVQDADLGKSTFWMIDLETGGATMVGEIGAGAMVDAIAVVPAPAGTGLLAIATLALARRRR